ncbi:MAG TPA: 30S ribosomal protein S9 [Candidatus Magasanikbacteria bacterium]|nr:30S ribosomal protein S9 [Candidatus Magasanikbacteria bacterium]
MKEKITKPAENSRAVGRRKTASARVRITPGKGKIVINDRPLEKYFTTEVLRNRALSPLVVTSRLNTLDITVKVIGGGSSSQAGAVRHGIARALVEWDETLKPTLRAEGFMTRDPRAKERKKFGKHKARRGHQWRKR